MSEKALDAVFDNILSLRKEAKSLARRKNASLCAHVAIVAQEETSKYLMLYCKEHLPADLFRRRFQHLPKYKLMSAPYFVSGQISVVLNIEAVTEMFTDEELGGIRPFLTHLSKYVLSHVIRGSAEKTAEVVLEMLREHENEQVETARKEAVTKTERQRTTSVYVDVDDDLQIKSKPGDITMEEAEHYLEGLDVGIAALMFIRDPSMTARQYELLLPPRHRKRIVKDRRQFGRQLGKRLQGLVEIESIVEGDEAGAAIG